MIQPRVGYLSALILSLWCAVAHAQLVFTPVATGLTRPVAITNAGDGTGRLFITQQGGQILIYDGTQVLATPFLDISSKISCCGERGLLSVAFHPGYGTTSNYFYVYYTAVTTGDITIARYTVSADANVADANSELVLLSIPHSTYANHNGGQLQFHPGNGYLYAGTGDGGGGGDPLENGQNLNALLGKILRLDVDAAPPYIPASNPYANDGDPNTRGEIWSYGLRNPWRFSFDRLTNDIVIGDVGQNCWEEVDYRPASSTGGENYAWDVMEGLKCYDEPSGSDCNLPPTCIVPGFTNPVLVYSHSLPNVQAVTGGYVYRGTDMPSYYGMYFFADYASGQIFTSNPSGTSWSFSEAASTGNLISSFGEDEAGELYYASLGFSPGDGAVYRISVPPSLPYHDDFEDNDASDWTPSKGSWVVNSGILQGSTNRKATILSPFTGCTQCTIEADLQADSAGARVWLLGWNRSKNDTVELILEEDRDLVLLKQRSNGMVVAKKKAALQVDPGVNYHVKVSYDGTQFQVFVDGSPSPLITLNAGGPASGGVGFRVRSITGALVSGSFAQIDVY